MLSERIMGLGFRVEGGGFGFNVPMPQKEGSEHCASGAPGLATASPKP